MDLQMALAKGSFAVPAENFHELILFLFKTAVVAPKRRFAAPRRRKKTPLSADEIAKLL